MTTQAVTNDRKANRPSFEQVDTYTRREHELRQRFLKGVLDIGEVLDGLQRLLEATRGSINCNVGPEIPNWADQDNPIVMHIPGGMVDPAMVETADVFKDGEEFLGSDEFVRRGQATEGSANACALDFYARPENWKYLAQISPEVTMLVFTGTIFRHSDGLRCVRFLFRRGAGWCRFYYWIGRRFSRGCRVVRFARPPALGPQV